MSANRRWTDPPHGVRRRLWNDVGWLPRRRRRRSNCVFYLTHNNVATVGVFRITSITFVAGTFRSSSVTVVALSFAFCLTNTTYILAYFLGLGPTRFSASGIRTTWSQHRGISGSRRSLLLPLLAIFRRWSMGRNSSWWYQGRIDYVRLLLGVRLPRGLLLCLSVHLLISDKYYHQRHGLKF